MDELTQRATYPVRRNSVSSTCSSESDYADLFKRVMPSQPFDDIPYWERERPLPLSQQSDYNRPPSPPPEPYDIKGPHHAYLLIFPPPAPTDAERWKGYTEEIEVWEERETNRSMDTWALFIFCQGNAEGRFSSDEARVCMGDLIELKGGSYYTPGIWDIDMDDPEERARGMGERWVEYQVEIKRGVEPYRMLWEDDPREVVWLGTVGEEGMEVDERDAQVGEEVEVDEEQR
ncbi:hypothetical protein BKA70DRAFT_437782, partial [Coprinopsis sp. MPI-PUGE-AT-0042]